MCAVFAISVQMLVLAIPINLDDSLYFFNDIIIKHAANTRKWVENVIRDPLQLQGVAAWNEAFHTQLPTELRFEEMRATDLARLHLAIQRLADENSSRPASSRIKGETNCILIFIFDL
jgi:hypothetical protein